MGSLNSSMAGHIKNPLCTDRQTDITENITFPHSFVGDIQNLTNDTKNFEYLYNFETTKLPSAYVVDNNFSRVYLSVCLSVSVYLFR